MDRIVSRPATGPRRRRLRRRPVAVLGLSLLALIVTPSGALAARDATPKELAAFAAANNVGDGPQCLTDEDGTSPVAGTDLEGRVSELDPTWGLSYRSGACSMAEGRTLYRIVGGTWTVVTTVSGFNYCRAVSPALPDRVGEELGMCDPTPGGTVLGAPGLMPNGKGWGASRPRIIYNGGVPSGLIVKIRWKHWGSRTATGRGRTFIYKPQGGYYRGSVRAQLRAGRLGTCTTGGRKTYRRLEVRVPSRPGGKLGRWFSWSGAQDLCSID